MYSMVLMMAMTSSPDAVACHPTGCSGCTGYVVSGCSGYASGCRGGLFSGHSCRGYSCTGYVVNSCGCCGTRVRHHGCMGYSSCMGYGCTGYSCTGGGCMGTPVEAPMPPKDMPKKEDIKPKVTSAPAYITVNVPADAKVTIDGSATVSTSAVRVYSTPTLAAGTVYYYTFAAEVTRDGKTFTATEKVAVEAGANPVITLNPSAAFPTVASK